MINDPVGRAKAHDLEQTEAGKLRPIIPQEYEPGNLRCLLSVHVDDTKDIAPKEAADPLLVHLNESVGPCNGDYGSFLHIGLQHEHASGQVITHQRKPPEKHTQHPSKTASTIPSIFLSIAHAHARNAMRSGMGVAEVCENERAW